MKLYRESREKPIGWMFVLGYLAYSSIYIARLNFSIVSAVFETTGVLTKTQIGIIGSIFSFLYAFGKIPNGYFGDRFSSRNVVVCGLLIISISNLLIGFLPVFWSIAVLWGLNAYGQSMLWGPIIRSFIEHYEEKRARLLLQYFVSAVATGSILGLIIASYCVTAFGVAACFMIPGVISFVLAILVRLFFINSPGKAAIQEDFASTAKSLLKKRQFRQIIFPTLSHGMIKDNINVWMAVYFVDCYKTDISNIAGFVFLIPVFALIGRFLYPIFYRLIKNDYGVAFFAFTLCVLANFLLFLGKLSVIGAILCLGADAAFVSVINSFMLSQFPISISDENNLSFIASIMDLVTYGGAGIGSIIFGILIERCGYSSMFLIWCLFSLFSALIMWSLSKFENRNTELAELTNQAYKISK